MTLEFDYLIAGGGSASVQAVCFRAQEEEG